VIAALSLVDRILVALGALAGLAGVALSAAAAHRAGAGNLDTAARFLLLHAPVLIACAALSATALVPPWLGRAAGLVLLAGLALFAGDLIHRVAREGALFPMAAPAGGVLMMVGWGLIALAALVPVRG
jgi:uncharacterized membrane protein YgdD (TMEM256/DUF423 family)